MSQSHVELKTQEAKQSFANFQNILDVVFMLAQVSSEDPQGTPSPEDVLTEMMAKAGPKQKVIMKLIIEDWKASQDFVEYERKLMWFIRYFYLERPDQ